MVRKLLFYGILRFEDLCDYPNPCFGLELGKAYTLGFGFDHVSNDYKVFRVYSCSGEHPVIEGFVENISKVEMFRLSTGLWEDITDKANFKGVSRR
ncbi:hypothetical protein LIER_01585 [Lithospermum erythrorhizon]|uniref:F-box associated domain-containing protein n=1 Tax=Lithospermum erythrorhizon TaxID=34254 RepID=A0AAV3NM58_LITER